MPWAAFATVAAAAFSAYSQQQTANANASASGAATAAAIAADAATLEERQSAKDDRIIVARSLKTKTDALANLNRVKEDAAKVAAEGREEDAQQMLRDAQDLLEQSTQAHIAAEEDLRGRMDAARQEKKQIAEEQFTDWEETFGTVQDNLSNFYSNLTPDTLSASGLEGQAQMHQQQVQEFRAKSAQQGFSSPTQLAMEQNLALQNAGIKAGIRHSAKLEVAKAQSGFIAEGKLNTGYAAKTDAATADSTLYDARGRGLETEAGGLGNQAQYSAALGSQQRGFQQLYGQAADNAQKDYMQSIASLGVVSEEVLNADGTAVIDEVTGKPKIKGNETRAEGTFREQITAAQAAGFDTIEAHQADIAARAEEAARVEAERLEKLRIERDRNNRNRNNNNVSTGAHSNKHNERKRNEYNAGYSSDDSTGGSMI